jgi:hypothetical protein
VGDFWATTLCVFPLLCTLALGYFYVALYFSLGFFFDVFRSVPSSWQAFRALRLSRPYLTRGRTCI